MSEQSKAEQLYDQLMERVNGTVFQASPDEQVRVVKLYRDLEPFLTPERQVQTLHCIADAVNANHGTKHTPKRIEQIAWLDHEEDIRSALLSNPNAEHDRVDEKENALPKTGWLGEYLKWAQEGEAPLAYHYWSALAILGSACRRNVYHQFGSVTLYPNQYVLLVSKSGSRKSYCLETSTSVLDQAMSMIKEKYAQGCDEFRIVQLPQSASPEYILDSISIPEHNTRISDSVGLICADELAVLLDKDKYGAAHIVHLLTALYGAQRDFKSGGVVRGERLIRNVAMTFMGGTTAAWMKKMSEDLLTGGFLPRCIMVHRQDNGGRARSKPGFLDPVMRTRLAKCLMPLITGQVLNAGVEKRIVLSGGVDGGVQTPSPLTMSVQLDPEADAWYEHWYASDKKIRENTGESSGYLSRKGQHLLKHATLLAVSDAIWPSGYIQKSPVITVGYMKTALRILDIEERYWPQLFRNLGTSKEAALREDMLEWLVRRAKAVPYSEFSLAFMNRFDYKKQFESQVDYLKSCHLVQTGSVKLLASGKGKKRMIWATAATRMSSWKEYARAEELYGADGEKVTEGDADGEDEVR